LQPGDRQLGADHHRHRRADDEHDEAENQVQRADVLVVGRKEPTVDEALLVGVVIVVISNGVRGSHGLPLNYVCLTTRTDQPATATAGAASSSEFGACSTGAGAAGAAAGAGALPALRAASHWRYSAGGTALTTIGMKPWSLPHSSAHWPR